MTHGTHGPQWIADEIRKVEKMNDKIDTSLEAVERFSSYSVMMSLEDGKSITSPDGEWVRYDDYAALSARVAEYEVRLRELAARCLHLSKGEARLSGLLNERATELACAEQRAATLEERYLAVAGDKINLRGEVATLEAKIKAYMEAAADAAGGAPDKYAEEQRAFIALRCAVNWPTPASCATLEAINAEIQTETKEPNT